MATHEHANHHSHQPDAGSDRGSRARQRRRRTRRQPPTSLQVVASTFALVTTGPGALHVDGARLEHGLPRRPIGLDELRAILSHPATSRPCRQAIWQHLLTSARTQAPAWLIGAAGVALPELYALADALTESLNREAADVHAAVLSGFTAGIKHIDPNQPDIASTLRWMAYHTAIKSARRRTGHSMPITSTWSHPAASADAVLSDAVASGILSPLQAELISRIRIDNLPLTDAAAGFGITHKAARSILRRGEVALATAISAGDAGRHQSGTEFSCGLAVVRPHRRPGSVRGRSTHSDGTSETGTSATEEGVFCGPAHHPTPAADQTRQDHNAQPHHAQVRCTHIRNGGPSPRRSGGSS